MVAKRKLLWVSSILVVGLGVWLLATHYAPSAKQTQTPTPAETNVVATVEPCIPVQPQSVTNESKGYRIDCSQTKTVVPTHAIQTPQPPKVRKPVTYDPKIPKARQVLLANRRIAIASGRSFPKKFCATQTPTSRGTAPYVVISELPVSRDVRIQAVADGAKVTGFLPNNALLVEADAQALKNLEEDVLFTAAVEYEPTDKIQRVLLDAAKDDARIEATIVLLNEKDTSAIRDYLVENGGEALNGMPGNGKSVSATIPYSLVEKLARKAEVKWIEKFMRMKVHNDLSATPACMNVTPVWNLHGLDGAGEVLSSADTGIDTGNISTLHEDFADKITGIFDLSGCGTPQDMYGHGTHTAGSIVGSGAKSNGQYCGIAKGANLYVMAGGNGTRSDSIYFKNGLYYWEIFAPAKLAYKTYIQSDSWGGDCAGTYTAWCAGLDDTAWDYPELLIVMANGNSGPSAKTVNQPAVAKNCLAVGNTYSTRNGANPATIASSSSRGPCADNRIKPDVAAPGTSIISTRSSQALGSGDYCQMSGTSMATPHVAGAAAIVRQWLRRDRGFDNADHKPSGALIKAILTGGATGNMQPDNDFGWGRIDLEASIFPTNGLGVFLADWLPFAATSNFSFRVTTTNTAPLRAQLVWFDFCAESGAAVALINDLDLTVASAADGESKKWFGNGGTSRDEINTVESVRIENAPKGHYLIRVECTKIMVAHDDPEWGGGAAALYIRGAFDPADVEIGAKVGTIWTIK